MDMYAALQGILSKIRENNNMHSMGCTEREMLRSLMENQERLAEAILVLGGVIHTAIADSASMGVLSNKRGDLQ